MTDRTNILLLILCCAFLYCIGMTSIHLTDPDEVFYAETAKEMLLQKSFLVPLIFDKPQFEKPPLFYWLLIFSMKIFGIGTLAARIIPAVFGIVGVLGTYVFTRKIFDKNISFYAALILATSFLYFGLSKAVLTDLVFSVFVAFSLYAFYLWYRFKGNFYMVLFITSLSLAVLTKGPLAIVLVFAAAILFLALTKGFKVLPALLFNRYWLIFLVLGCGWYIYASLRYGRDFLWEFFVHDNWHRIIYAEHARSDKWYFYPAIMLLGMFPWTAYLFILGKGFKRYKNEYIFFLSWILSTFVILTLVHSKLPSYIFPLMPALCCALSISLISLDNRSKFAYLVGIANIAIGAGLFFLLPRISKKYPDLYAFLFLGVLLLFLSMALAGTFFILRRKKLSIIFNILGIVLFLSAGVSSVPSKLDTAFTDYDLKEIVREYNYQGKPIVCDKMYARGARFYTGNPVLVMNTSKNPFWSEHPIGVLSTDEEILAFFQDKDRVLCVLDKGDFKRMDNLLAGNRENRVISKNLTRYVILSERINR